MSNPTAEVHLHIPGFDLVERVITNNVRVKDPTTGKWQKDAEGKIVTRKDESHIAFPSMSGVAIDSSAETLLSFLAGLIAAGSTVKQSFLMDFIDQIKLNDSFEAATEAAVTIAPDGSVDCSTEKFLTCLISGPGRSVTTIAALTEEKASLLEEFFRISSVVSAAGPDDDLHAITAELGFASPEAAAVRLGQLKDKTRQLIDRIATLEADKAARKAEKVKKAAADKVAAAGIKAPNI